MIKHNTIYEARAVADNDYRTNEVLKMWQMRYRFYSKISCHIFKILFSAVLSEVCFHYRSFGAEEKKKNNFLGRVFNF